MAEHKSKSPVLALIILLIVSLALIGGTFFLLQKEKTKNIALQDELEDIKTRLRVTENKLDESKKTIADLGAKLDDAQTKIAALTVDLDKEKVAKEEAKALIEQLRIDLDQQKSLRQGLEKKVSEAQKDAVKMQAQLKELETKKDELEAKVKNLEVQAKQAQSQGVELGKIVVSPEAAPVKPTTNAAKKEKQAKKAAAPAPAAQVTSGLEGKVLVINRDYSFVVINLGSKDGVNVGDVFSVYRKDDQYIGDVKVEKVHESMAAAEFVSSDIKDKVNESDKVVRKAK